MIRTVARTNVYNREQGESGAEEMKREGGERRGGEEGRSGGAREEK